MESLEAREISVFRARVLAGQMVSPHSELQARWIAYAWSGLLPSLSGETMRNGADC